MGESHTFYHTFQGASSLVFLTVYTNFAAIQKLIQISDVVHNAAGADLDVGDATLL